MLHHCVGNDGSGERYYERMERRESFILFLRRTDEPEDPITHWRSNQMAQCVRSVHYLTVSMRILSKQLTFFADGKSYCRASYRS